MISDSLKVHARDYVKVFGKEGMSGGFATEYWKVGRFYFWVKYSPTKGMETRWTQSVLYSDRVELADILPQLPAKLVDPIIFNLDLFR